MVRSHVPFSHFNAVLTLGCPAVANDAAFAAIDRFYAAAPGGRHWVVVNDHSQPADLAIRLLARGYAADGGWDRVLLRGCRTDRWSRWAVGCEEVDRFNRQEWSDFIRGCYGMPPPIADWLHALVGRPGWIHAIRRAEGQAGAPVAMARSIYIASSGWAWLGIDAPVPGLMAPCFDDDRAVSATLLMVAERAGAHSFVSDVEAANVQREGPA